MPAGQPKAEDERRYHYAGCIIDPAISGSWYCSACEQYYDTEHVRFSGLGGSMTERAGGSEDRDLDGGRR